MLLLPFVCYGVLNFNQSHTVLHLYWSRSSTKQMHWESQTCDAENRSRKRREEEKVGQTVVT